MKKYLIKNLYIPTIIIFIILILLIIVINTIAVLTVPEFPFFCITLKFKSINNIFYIIIIVISTFYYFLQKLKSYNKDKVFLIGNLYGDISFTYYRWARCIGFTKVDLIRKPYYIMYKLIDNKFFEIVNLEEGSSKASIDVKIINNDVVSNIVNIIIKDTYDIKKEELPEEIINLPTIIIDRIKPEKSIRVYSKELIQISSKIILEQFNENKTVNLF